MQDHMVPTLRYFDCRGRAQPLRDFLWDRGVVFNDEQVSLTPVAQEWPRLKQDQTRSGPFGTLPVLEWDQHEGGPAVLMAETLPIAAFVVRRLQTHAGLPSRIVATLEMTRSAAYIDLILWAGHMLWSDITNPGADVESAVRLQAPRALEKLKRLDALAADGDFFGGAEPSLADFFVLEGAESLIHMMGRPAVAFVNALPRLGPLCERLRRRPAVKAVWASGARPARLTGRPDELEVVHRLRAADWSDVFPGH
jgi:glutathione S-transferase